MNGQVHEDPEMYDQVFSCDTYHKYWFLSQETYGQDDLDEMSERGSFALPKTHAPVANVENYGRTPNYNDSTLHGSLLRGKGRMNAETAEQFKDLSLPEIIRLLEHHQNDIRANAAGYLQHLSYENIEKKNEIRNSGGIPKLIEVLEERTNDARIIGIFYI